MPAFEENSAHQRPTWALDEQNSRNIMRHRPSHASTNSGTNLIIRVVKKSLALKQTTSKGDTLKHLKVYIGDLHQCLEERGVFGEGSVHQGFRQTLQLVIIPTHLNAEAVIKNKEPTSLERERGCSRQTIDSHLKPSKSHTNALNSPLNVSETNLPEAMIPKKGICQSEKKIRENGQLFCLRNFISKPDTSLLVKNSTSNEPQPTPDDPSQFNKALEVRISDDSSLQQITILNFSSQQQMVTTNEPLQLSHHSSNQQQVFHGAQLPAINQELYQLKIIHESKEPCPYIDNLNQEHVTQVIEPIVKQKRSYQRKVVNTRESPRIKRILSKKKVTNAVKPPEIFPEKLIKSIPIKKKSASKITVISPKHPFNYKKINDSKFISNTSNSSLKSSTQNKIEADQLSKAIFPEDSCYFSTLEHVLSTSSNISDLWSPGEMASLIEEYDLQSDVEIPPCLELDGNLGAHNLIWDDPLLEWCRNNDDYAPRK